MNHSEIDHTKMKQASLDAETKQHIVSALKINEDLHRSFFDYDAKAVEKNSKALKDSLSKIKNPEVSKILKYSESKLGDIDSSNTREQNNEIYHTVSMTLIHLISKYDVGENYQGYYCPMVKKKWLQNTAKSKDTQNPYSPDMKSCGSIETH